MRDETFTPVPTVPAGDRIADFLDRARQGLHSGPPPEGAHGASDTDLDPDLAPLIYGAAPPTPAAVLVPIVSRSQPTLLLTQRTAHLPSHAGQIAFPGGKIDPSDRDATAAALREAEEEIGLGADRVRPIGFLDRYRTGTGYTILPVVAVVEPGFTLALNTEEVADVFEVPLAFLMDPANHQRHRRPWQGRERQFFAMPYEGRFIWGATAGMIRNMHQRLFAT